MSDVVTPITRCGQLIRLLGELAIAARRGFTPPATRRKILPIQCGGGRTAHLWAIEVVAPSGQVIALDCVAPNHLYNERVLRSMLAQMRRQGHSVQNLRLRSCGCLTFTIDFSDGRRQAATK